MHNGFSFKPGGLPGGGMNFRSMGILYDGFFGFSEVPGFASCFFTGSFAGLFSVFPLLFGIIELPDHIVNMFPTV